MSPCFTACPPLVLPALKAFAGEMYDVGRRGERVPGMRWRFWRWLFPVFFMVLAAGWIFMPPQVYCAVLAVYGSWIVLAALATLSLRSLPCAHDRYGTFSLCPCGGLSDGSDRAYFLTAYGGEGLSHVYCRWQIIHFSQALSL